MTPSAPTPTPPDDERVRLARLIYDRTGMDLEKCHELAELIVARSRPSGDERKAVAAAIGSVLKRLGFVIGHAEALVVLLEMADAAIAAMRPTPPAPAADGVTDLLRRMDEFLVWKVSSDVRSEGNDLLRAITAALAALAARKETT